MILKIKIRADKYFLCSTVYYSILNPLVLNPIYTSRRIMIFTMWVCYIKVGTKPNNFFSKIPSFTDFMHVSYMIHWALVVFLILQFTQIPLVYRQIEKNDKIPLVNVHRVKYEQFPNFIDKIHILKISILPSLICQICPVYHIW